MTMMYIQCILILNLLLEIVNAIEVVTLLNVEDLMWVVRELPSWVWSTYLFTNEYKNIMIRTCVNSVKKNKSLKNFFLNNCISKQIILTSLSRIINQVFQKIDIYFIVYQYPTYALACLQGCIFFLWFKHDSIINTGIKFNINPQHQ